MRAAVVTFLAALVFYTRIPCPASIELSAAEHRHASAFAPLVGWVVGLISAAGFFVVAMIAPLSVAVVAAIVIPVALTGALHEDGFADFCDGFGSGADGDRTLEIMKDPRSGAFAVIGLVLLTLAKFVALLEIAQAAAPFGPLLAVVFGSVLTSAHALSRLAAVSFMFNHDHVRSRAESKAAPVVDRMPADAFAFALVCGLAPLAWLAWLGGTSLTWSILPVILVRQWVGHLFVRRLGGFTGDCLGAVQQLTEVTFYLSVCALLSGTAALIG